jgi:hypothetical protein
MQLFGCYSTLHTVHSLAQLSKALHEDGDIIQSPKRCVLIRNRMMGKSEELNNCGHLCV